MFLPTSEMACSSKLRGVCFIALFCESMICFANAGVRKVGEKITLSLRENPLGFSWQSIFDSWIAPAFSKPSNDDGLDLLKSTLQGEF